MKKPDAKVKYKNLFNNRINAMAFCQIIVDKKRRPIDYVFLEVNKTFERLTGLKKNFIINRKVTDVIPNFFKTERDFINICGKVALTGKETTCEKYFEAFKESPEKWYSFFIYSPQKGYFVSISNDITNKKKAEEEIKKLNIELERKVIERTKKYQDLVENINDAIYQLDINGKVVYASPVIKKITGYNAREVLGKNVMSFIHPDDVRETRIRFRSSLLGNSSPYETRIIKKNGSVAYIRSSGHSLIKKGEVKGVISALTDITDYKKKEKRLLESYNYVGIMNRKISMLLDLEKMSNDTRRKNQRKVFEYIAKLATNIFGADTVALFKTIGDEDFGLVFSSGWSRRQAERINRVPIKKNRILKKIWEERTKVFGSFSNNHDAKTFELSRENKNFVILPIKSHKELKGMLFLGFNQDEGVDNQELDFLDVFAIHVSLAVINAEIIK